MREAGKCTQSRCSALPTELEYGDYVDTVSEARKEATIAFEVGKAAEYVPE